jgi:hypothetical protein
MRPLCVDPHIYDANGALEDWDEYLNITGKSIYSSCHHANTEPSLLKAKKPKEKMTTNLTLRLRKESKKESKNLFR